MNIRFTRNKEPVTVIHTQSISRSLLLNQALYVRLNSNNRLRYRKKNPFNSFLCSLNMNSNVSIKLSIYLNFKFYIDFSLNLR